MRPHEAPGAEDGAFERAPRYYDIIAYVTMLSYCIVVYYSISYHIMYYYYLLLPLQSGGTTRLTLLV